MFSTKWKENVSIFSRINEHLPIQAVTKSSVSASAVGPPGPLQVVTNNQLLCFCYAVCTLQSADAKAQKVQPRPGSGKLKLYMPRIHLILFKIVYIFHVKAVKIPNYTI